MKQIPPSSFLNKFFILMLVLTGLTNTVLSQDDECGARASNQDYQLALSQLEVIRQAAENAPSSAIAIVPVRFYIVLDDNGAPAAGASIDEAYINTVLASLSTKFSTNSDYTFKFELCGEINYIHNTSFKSGLMKVDDYAHVAQATNVYVLTSGSAEAQFPWGSGINNKIFINTYNLLDSKVPHEFGHHFGLWHTFEPERTYHVPDFPNLPFSQEDHPYNNSQSGRPRELVIRIPDQTKTYPTPNHGGPPYNGPNNVKGGDWIGETPAGCRTYSGTNFNYPGCAFDLSNCTYTGTYVDYNGMPINDPDNILVKNFMSYTNNCRQEFVDEQLDRAYGYYSNVRQWQYWQLYPEQSCGNLEDRVEYEGTDIGQDRVAVEITQSGGLILKALTGSNGDFDGIIHEPVPGSASVTSNVQKLGPNADFSFNWEDWVDGVTTYDIILIRRHILNINILDGYDQVAADVNNSGSVTTFDLVLIRELILQENSTFPDFNQPWRFIPEFVTLNHPEHFDDGDDDNPFQFDLTGTQNYQLTPGKQGFDAVKLGDVNNTNSESFVGDEPPSEGAPVYVTVSKTVADGISTYDFRVQDFEDIVAYQMDIEFTPEYLQFSGTQALNLAGVNSDFFGTTQAIQGTIKTLWYDETHTDAFTLPDGSGIFRLIFNGNGNHLQANVQLSQSIGYRSNDKQVSLRNFAFAPDGTIRPIIQRDYYQGAIAAMTIMPNPFASSFLLSVEAVNDGSIEMNVFNSIGQNVYQAKEKLLKGSNSLQLSGLSHLPGGVYFIVVNSGGDSIVKKLVKKS